MPHATPLAAARRLPDGNPPPLADSVAALLAARLGQGGHAPFLTFYDDRTGERTELSHATLENWVAKTANLLVEELELGRGDRVLTALGTHWTAVVVAFACWRAGCCLVTVDRHPELLRGPAAAVFVREEELAAAPAGDGPVVVVGAGLGGRLADAGVDLGDALPYAEEVLAFGDDFDDPGVTLDDDALVVPGARDGADVRLDQGNLLAAATATETWGLGADDRLLCARPAHALDGLVLGHLGALVAGASVVLAAGAPGAWRKAADERCTLALLGAGDLTTVAADCPSTVRGLLVPSGAPRGAGPARARFAVPVAFGHGLPDASGAAVMEPLMDAGTLAWVDARPGRPAGVATAQAAVGVLDGDGVPAPAGREGRLGVRGPVVLAGYEGLAVPDEELFADDWLLTGEHGVTVTGPDGAMYVFVTRERGPDATPA